MIRDILYNKFQDYRPSNTIEQESLLGELMQQYILASLSRAGFFSKAGFHGGTCLRILYGLNRFSEDLDFLLKFPDPLFKWQPYLQRIQTDFRNDGLIFEIQDKSDLKTRVKKVFLKTDSIGKILLIDLPYSRDVRKIIKIKLEIDTNPPPGSAFETRYITFPVAAAITSQTLNSGFSLKSHALLCRGYSKGRDWYDFLWYISKKRIPDLKLLTNAINQLGPWANQNIQVDVDWYYEVMKSKINEIDWELVKNDVRRFINAREQESIDLWSSKFFLFHLDQLSGYAR